MSDPVVEAVLRAIPPLCDGHRPTALMAAAAGEVLKPIRAKHYPVVYVNRQQCCVTCFDGGGKPHPWPCPVAPLIYSSEELQ
ncbi:hypothetical protein SEA_KALAH2_136 [Mycobacterium phage Kalah2]|nr:hypothetical protein SEA_KALAH2_136 [Mycobacterium phage Kalah2]